MIMQVVIYFIPMFTNPIFIHSIVVFVRLYWFEKRFQNVVKEARQLRRIRSRSRSMTRGREDRDIQAAEHGVNGRDIVVLRDQAKRMATDAGANGNPLSPENAVVESESETSDTHKNGSISSNKSQIAPLPLRREQPPSFHRNITFADEITSPLELSPSTRMPRQLSPEEHIAILENQRNPKDKGTLRIPGPRESDSGLGPQALQDESDRKSMGRPRTQSNEPRPFSRDISIEEPNRGDLRKVPSRLTFRTSATNRSRGPNDQEKTPITPARGRAGTFSTFKRTNTQQKESAPYLSWEPTIGRNSAFVDLTEEQREELGGNEYRSLKTLTVILIGKRLLRYLVMS